LRILLDENFPVQLYHRLISSGVDAEHLIVSGHRGIPDTVIRRRLQDESDLVLLTHDTEFEDLDPTTAGLVVISRVPQGLPIERRVEIWLRAVVSFMAAPPAGRLFDLLASGAIITVDVRPLEKP